MSGSLSYFTFALFAAPHGMDVFPFGLFTWATFFHKTLKPTTMMWFTTLGTV